MPLPGQVAPYVCQLRIAVWSALSPHMELLHATDLLPMQGFFFCDFASLSLPLSLPLSPSLSPSFSLSLPPSLSSFYFLSYLIFVPWILLRKSSLDTPGVLARSVADAAIVAGARDGILPIIALNVENCYMPLCCFICLV